MKRAFVTGITGQDGSYLTELLLAKGYEVHGFARSYDRESDLPLPPEVVRHTGDIRVYEDIAQALQRARPDEVYNLAAQSHVGASYESSEETEAVNFHGMGNVVNAAMQERADIRIYQASTSEMFGTAPPPQSETSPFQPFSPYGKAKLRAHEEYVVAYRERHGLFVCSGFLFNHESPRRATSYVTRKITSTLARIARGRDETLALGSFGSKRDWGFAGDYVEAMWQMLQLDSPEDFVIATGVQHSVRDLISIAADELGLPLSFSGEGIDEVGRDDRGVARVVVDKRFHRAVDPSTLYGDAGKAERLLDWKPTVSFDALIRMMARADLARVDEASR